MPDSARITRHATLAGLTGIGARAVSFVAFFAAVPFVLEGAGQERFGLWMLVTSLVMSFGFLDLGLANGMLTALSHASADDASAQRARIVATGFALLAALAAATAALGLIVVATVDWHGLLNAGNAVTSRELAGGLLVLVMAVAMGIVAGAVQKVYFGLHLGSHANLWQALGALASLACLVAVARHEPTLPELVAAALLPPVLAWLAGAAVLFARLGPELRPRPGNVSAPLAHKLGRDGLLYLALQASAAVALHSDNLLLAAALGTEDLAAYSIVARVFGAIVVVVGIMAYPLWAAFGAAAAAGDSAWIAAKLRSSLLLSVAFAGGCSVVLALAFEPLMHAWLGDDAPYFPAGLILAMAVWTLVNSLGAVVSALLNGLRIIRLQLAIAAVFTPTCLGLKWMLAHRIGPEGIAWAATVCYLVIVLVPYAFVVAARLRAAAPPAGAAAATTRRMLQ